MAGNQGEKSPTSTSPRTPGILFVTSDTLFPQILSHSDFDSWYITTHIPLVLTTAKPQIGTATRYEHIPYSSALPTHPLDPSATSIPRLGLLTIYDMKDVAFTESREFKSLEKAYEGRHRESVFKNAEFDARCYEDVPVSTIQPSSLTPAPILLCASMSGPPPPPPRSPSPSPSSHPYTPIPEHWDMETWFQTYHLPFFNKISGYRASKLYKFKSRSLLTRVKVTYPSAREYLVVHEFEGMRIPGIGFRDVESEMGRLKAEILAGRTQDWGKMDGDDEGDEKGKREGREGKDEMEFTFWVLTGQYWAKGQ